MAEATLNGYRFDPELTKRIQKYKDFEIYPGGHKAGQRRIRWLLEDKDGISVYCDQCGNFANLCLLEIHGRYLLKVPICKRHAEDLMKTDPEYTVRDLLLFKKSELDLIRRLSGASAGRKNT